MKNKNLLDVQNEWYEKIAIPFINTHCDKAFSLPFLMGISDAERNLPTIMVVGQEAKNYGGFFDKEWANERIQEWNIDYVETQVKGEKSKFESKYNKSPFWIFFRELYKRKIVPYWNNLDKLHMYLGGKTKTLNKEYERQLNQSLPQSKKSLLMNEIEIVKPDAIVFVTGPYYIVSMETALGLSDKALSNYKPNCRKEKGYCQDITKVLNLGVPVLWTYHPHFLARSNSLKKCVDAISEKIIVK